MLPYLINMQDDTRLLQKLFFFLDCVHIPNSVMDSCQKYYTI